MVVSELVRSLLHKRGITDLDAIEKFLEPDYERDTHEPMLLEGMERAVTRLLLAMQQNERIAVYADFDCDGIPGAAVLSDFFKKVGYENFEVYLPHRDNEGYGFHTEAIEKLASRGVSLIITVDVGTNAVEAVDFAKKKGVDVIVTDHHEVSDALPDCVAVLNPKIGDYPFRDLCGAAMAWKLACATLTEGKKRKNLHFWQERQVPEGWEKWLLDMVALATIADLVPLVGENRVLAHYGLKVLRKSPRKGLRALFERLRLRQDELSEDDVAFSIAPRINAASRMDSPELALQLLTTDDELEAETLAKQLDALNTKRKSAVASIVREAKKRVAVRFSASDRVVVLGDTSWKPALLGLVANSIMENRGSAVCVWGRDAKGKLKGSCRSDGSVSIVELFTAAKDALVESGGHARSGGFTVSHEQIHTLPERLAEAATQLRSTAVDENAEADALISLSDVSVSVWNEVSLLAPFGVGNSKPRFLISEVIVTDVRRFGKESAHVELALECRRSGARARAFDFFRSPERFSHIPSAGGEARVLASLERDSYRGGFALRLVDVVSRA